MNRLEVGKIVNTHGLRGEVKVVTWTDSPEDFEKIKHVFAEKKGGAVPLTVSNVKYQKNNIILKFKEINSIEEAEGYKPVILTAERSELPPLPEGRHYVVDLIGCTVENKDGKELGILTDVFTAGAGNVYDIKPDSGSNILVPANDNTIISIDIDGKRIIVDVPEEWED